MIAFVFLCRGLVLSFKVGTNVKAMTIVVYCFDSSDTLRHALYEVLLPSFNEVLCDIRAFLTVSY